MDRQYEAGGADLLLELACGEVLLERACLEVEDEEERVHV